MAIFFTADSHFSKVDYDGIIKRDYRPFKSLAEMNKKIISTWNKQAGKNDMIYHLGDFVNYNLQDEPYYLELLKLVKKVKAKVFLIMGNNEERIVRFRFNNDFEKFREFMKDLGFFEVVRDLELQIGDNKYYLNHLPKKHREGFINLFGHVHLSCFVKKYGFNVGVDTHYFKLFSVEDIEELVSRRDIFDDNVYD